MISTNKTLFFVNLHTSRLRHPSPSVDVFATACEVGDTVGDIVGGALACAALQRYFGALVGERTSRVHVLVVWCGVVCGKERSNIGNGLCGFLVLHVCPMARERFCS